MIASRILLALFNGAWQSGLVCAAAYFALRSTRRLNATNIHGVWNVLLCVSIALPIANYAFTKPAHHVRPATAAAAARYTADVVRLKTPAPLTAAAAQSGFDVGSAWFDAELWTLRHAAAFLAVMAALAAAKLAVLVRDLLVMFKLRRRVAPIAAPADVPIRANRSVAYAATDELQTPCVLGFARPLIVLPRVLLDDPDKNRLREVVVHEAAHVRRWDDVQNFVHRAIAAVLFFDPGVMLALHELAIAREAACDDAVLDARQDRVSYATTLSGMALWARRHSIAVPSLIVGKKQLVRRIEQLLDRNRNHTLQHDRPLTAASLLAVVLAGCALVHFQIPAVAQTLVKVERSLGMKHTAAPGVRTTSYSAAQLLALAAPEAPAVTPAVVVKAPAKRATPAKPAKLKQRLHTVPRVVPAAASVSPVEPMAPAPRRADLLDALDAGGYHDLPADQLIALRQHGVSGCLIETAPSTFAQRPTVDELVTLSDNGVSCGYLRQFGQAGRLVSVDVKQIVRLAQHGVSGSYYAGLLRRRYTPSIDQLVRLADHGVSLEYVDSLNRLRTAPLSIDELIHLHDDGFTPGSNQP